MQPYLDKFDVAAEEGLTTLNWETNGDELEKTRRDEYIEGATAAVDIVDEYTCSMKANLDHANEIMERWTSKPLLERDKKPVELIEFDRVFKKAKSERYADIKEGGKEVERMLKDTNKMLRVSNASLDWHAYIDFINNIVVDGRVLPRCCGAFTPSMRVVSRNDGSGWLFCRFWGSSDRVARPQFSTQVGRCDHRVPRVLPGPDRPRAHRRGFVTTHA